MGKGGEKLRGRPVVLVPELGGKGKVGRDEFTSVLTGEEEQGRWKFLELVGSRDEG